MVVWHLRPDLTLVHNSGYKTPVFSGKAEQRARVEAKVTEKGFLPKELVKFEVDWFYDSLGIEVSRLFVVGVIRKLMISLGKLFC